MASHLSDIGFQVETEKELQQLAARAYEEGEVFETSTVSYIKWAPGEGVELWLQLDRANDVIGINPHFSGSSVMRVGLTQRLVRSEARPLDGALHAWANPEGEDPETGAYPFVFDVPDYYLIDVAELPAIAKIQLAAFAHELQSYDNDEAYAESQSDEIKFASESFIPAGLFSPGGEATGPPEAHAIFTGHVLEASIITNPVTGVEFCWAKTKTIGGEIDVVADPALLNGLLIKGGVLSGYFWLSGRLST